MSSTHEIELYDEEEDQEAAERESEVEPKQAPRSEDEHADEAATAEEAQEYGDAIKVSDPLPASERNETEGSDPSKD